MEKDIKQVILNLLRNAAQALSGTSGQATPTITLRTRRDGNLALIQVEDNGTGMDQATQARIFDPFFTSRRIGEGTGLGLSVAYYIIVDTHRGNIQVESELGRGTRFTIKLPLGASAN
jgi:signal transduction histidine kinase